ncbi:MAG: ABC transporter permease [Spirochaetia bacterium]|jgi:peptide/nickel transport system permease protein|nr:ABC transporter permease [Spirochaetia bacterium]
MSTKTSKTGKNLTAKKKSEYRKRSQFAEIMRNLKKNKGAVVGLCIILLIILLTIITNFTVDYNSQIIRQTASQRLQRPSFEHPFGTDQYGRDIFLRVLYGARYSLLVGVVAVMVSLSIGGVLGIIAGYFGGFTETVIMRTTDIFSSIPSMLLAISISTAFGANIFILMISVGVVTVPAFARVARASVMTVRDQEFIEAARAIGASRLSIMFTHILPNALAPIIVQVTMRVGSAIITAASLSFLGLGVPAPAPEWGAMLSEGRSFIRNYSYMTMFPGLAIVLTVLSFNLIGDGLRDAMDPKLKR